MTITTHRHDLTNLTPFDSGDHNDGYELHILLGNGVFEISGPFTRNDYLLNFNDIVIRDDADILEASTIIDSAWFGYDGDNDDC